MGNAAELRSATLENLFSPFESEIADANQPLRLKDSHYRVQVSIACGEQSGFLGSRQLVGRAIAATALQERQRAIVHHDVFGKESDQRPEPLGKKSPQPPATDLRTPAGESGDWPPRMLPRGFAHGRLDFQPIADGSDFAERHADLGHDKWPRVNAKE